MRSTYCPPRAQRFSFAPTPGNSSGTVGAITIGSAGLLSLSSPGASSGVLITAVHYSVKRFQRQPGCDQRTHWILPPNRFAAVNQLVASGYADGQWNGAGINSSTAASDSTHLTALGVIQNNQGGSPVFSIFEGSLVGTADVPRKVYYFGDANLDGVVDGSDYSRIDNGYLSNGALSGWFNGDFNYDNVINGSDYTLIDNAFNSQGAQLSVEVAVSAEVAGFGCNLRGT